MTLIVRARRFLTASGALGLAIVLAVIVVAIFAPIIAPQDPAKFNLASRELPPAWMDGGNSSFLLGTDQLGRDVLSRIIFSSRVSVIVGVLGTVVALIIGLALGIIAGYFGKNVDAVISRALDTFMAIPFIILALAVIGVVGPQTGTNGVLLLIVVLGVSGWADFARVARAETLSTKNLPYVEATRALGQATLFILTRHVVPNIAAPLIVLSALQIGTVIIAEASLSFLGLGVQPPAVTWGTMLADGRNYVATSWWLATFPGIAITLTVVGSVLLGDWLRDLMDPHQ